MNHNERNPSGSFHPDDNLPEIVSGPVPHRITDYSDVIDLGESGGNFLEIAVSAAKKIWKHRWMIGTCFVAGVVISATYAFLCTPVFRSYGTVEINEEARQTVNPSIANSSGERDYFVTQIDILKSRSIAQELVHRNNLEESPEFNQKSMLSRLKGLLSHFGFKEEQTTSAEQKTDEVIRQVMDRISVQMAPKSRVVTLTMDAKDPNLAADMLRNYIDIYLEYNLHKRRSESLDASSWLKQELINVERQLSESRAALIDFTTKHGLVSMDKDLNTVVSGFISAANDRAKAVEGRLKAQAFEDRWKAGDILSWNSLPASHPLAKMRESLAALEAQYVEMSATYNENYPKVKILKTKIDNMRAKIRDLANSTVSAALETSAKEEALFEKSFEKAKKSAMQLNSLGAQYAILKKKVDTNEQIYQMFLQKAKEMEVASNVTGNNVSLLLSPVVPFNPVKPQKMIYVLLGGILGLTVGVLIAAAREVTDKSIKTEEELQTYLQVPSLGVIPDIKRLHGTCNATFQHGYQFIPHKFPEAAMYDALRNVYTSIASSLTSDTKTIVVSSAEPEEGKTFISAALASSICDDETRVLLIDCDLRRPRIHKVFRTCHNDVGLSNLLNGTDGVEEVVQKSLAPNLDIITSGRPSTNPVGLLQSSLMEKVLSNLRYKYDVIILDCPPVSNFSDARVLARKADGVLFVVKHGNTSRDILIRAIDSIFQSKGAVIGAVLNMSDPWVGGYKRYQKGFHKRYHRGP